MRMSHQNLNRKRDSTKLSRRFTYDVLYRYSCLNIGYIRLKSKRNAKGIARLACWP
jgi:hypothetical protein